MKSYDYAHRKDVEEITWKRFALLAANLTEKLAIQQIDMIIGIARAGLFPATAVACALRRELYPVRLTRRFNDHVIFEQPVWLVDVTPAVTGKVVGVVDEIADTGQTLNIVSRRVMDLGATRVVTSSLISHTWAIPLPDIFALLTDALVIFPWDRQVFQNGRWGPHPELQAALQAQIEKNMT